MPPLLNLWSLYRGWEKRMQKVEQCCRNSFDWRVGSHCQEFHSGGNSVQKKRIICLMYRRSQVLDARGPEDILFCHPIRSSFCNSDFTCKLVFSIWIQRLSTKMSFCKSQFVTRKDSQPSWVALSVAWKRHAISCRVIFSECTLLDFAAGCKIRTLGRCYRSANSYPFSVCIQHLSLSLPLLNLATGFTSSCATFICEECGSDVNDDCSEKKRKRFAYKRVLCV